MLAELNGGLTIVYLILTFIATVLAVVWIFAPLLILSRMGEMIKLLKNLPNLNSTLNSIDERLKNMEVTAEIASSRNKAPSPASNAYRHVKCPACAREFVISPDTIKDNRCPHCNVIFNLNDLLYK